MLLPQVGLVTICFKKKLSIKGHITLETVLELGGFASQFATHLYRVANQFSKWFAVCESFYEGMDCIIIHLLLMPATRNKPVCN